jgi:pyruvate/2-oxoglutarate dehydrogenase complex dihydrolipoamide acyltransferase (E2) component
MRILFLLLVAANLAFFAWLRFLAPPDPALDPLPMTQQLEPGRLRIVTEAELAQIAAAPAAAAAAPAASAAAPAAKPAPAQPPQPPESAPAPAKPAPPPEPAPLACVEWGSFSLQDAPRAEQRLEPLALGARLAQFRGEESATWWVFLPPQPNRAAAQKRAAELKRLGVEDYFVVQEEGKLRWALSLGIFRSEEAARARFEALRARGVRSAQVGRRETRVARVWFQVRGVDAALNARLQEIARDFEGATLHECAARG